MDMHLQESRYEALAGGEEEDGRFEHDFKSPVPEYVRKEGSVLFNRYFDFIAKYKAVVVLFWLCIFIVGAATGFEFMSKSNDAMLPPSGTRSADDQEAYTLLFPNRSRELPVIVVMEALDRTTGIDMGEREDLRNFTFRLVDELEQFNTRSPGFYLSAMGYYTLDGTPLDSIKDNLISKDRQVTFVNILVNQSYPTVKRGEFMKWFLQLVDDLNPDPKTYDIGTTGKIITR